MSEAENIELVRRLFGVFDTGDFLETRDMLEATTAMDDETLIRLGAVGETIRASIHPEIELQFFSELRPVEGARFEGLDGFFSMWRSWLTAFDEYHFDVSNFEAIGDSVLVDVTQGGRGRGSGLEVELQQTQVFTIREGLIVSNRIYESREDAVTALRAQR